MAKKIKTGKVSIPRENFKDENITAHVTVRLPLNLLKKRKAKPKQFKYKDANKQKGIILRSLDDGPNLFRIYDSKGGFKDYEIIHDDLAVQILDDSAEFLESTDGESFYLDYSREVLGQKKT